jgi:hypothetical protein
MTDTLYTCTYICKKCDPSEYIRVHGRERLKNTYLVYITGLMP